MHKAQYRYEVWTIFIMKFGRDLLLNLAWFDTLTPWVNCHRKSKEVGNKSDSV
jgi:hypothetical protein